jgi:2-methylisocitrate lyase-like PEP mutase family enzyme
MVPAPLPLPPLAVIGDGDTGYGNAVNVKRTVAGYAAAGLAGVLIEDQQVGAGWVR